MSAPSNDELKTLLLDHYHCTFFLPLLGFGKGLDPKADLKKIYPLNEKLNEADAEAFYYFTPTLRDIIFDRGEANASGLEAIQEWHLSADTLKDWRLELLPSKEQKDNAGGDAMKLALAHPKVEFQSVRLYRYFNGIYMLAFTVRPQVLCELHREDQVSLFQYPNDAVPRQLQDVPESDPHREQYQSLQLEAWLRFTRLGRQLYPTFTEQWSEEKIAPLHLFTTTESKTPTRVALNDKVSCCLPKSSEHLSPILIYLTEQFFAEDIHEQLEDEIRLFDDRMFVSVAYGLAGKKHNKQTRHLINTLIALTDRFVDCDPEMGGYPYTKKVTDRSIGQQKFDLWESKGGSYIFNDMVNGYLYNGGFFRDPIASKHIPYLYDRMLIQALFYQASLRHYDHEITTTTKELNIKDIQTQRGQFIKFTNQYWFREVTNQMQGKEIFRLQQQGLGLQEHYALLQDKITHTDEYLQALHEIRLAEEAANAEERANRLTLYAIALAIVAALPVVNDIFKTEPSLWQSIIEYFDGCSKTSSKDCSDWIIRTVLASSLLGATAIGIALFKLIPALWSKNKNPRDGSVET